MQQGSFNLVQNAAHKGPDLRPRCTGPIKKRVEPIYHSILFYATLHGDEYTFFYHILLN